MNLNKTYTDLMFIGILIFSFTSLSSPFLALILGLIFSIVGITNSKTNLYISIILKISIVLLGFGMNLYEVIEFSKNSIFETAIYIISIMSLGVLLGKLFRLEKKIVLLIAAGTAICGGSAIAILTPILACKNYQTSFALVVIFTLNIIALIIFPFVGYYFELSQETFGYWSAIAIHDTSSVIGATAIYGSEALKIGTTVKLIRTLWIIPLSLLIIFFKKDVSITKIKFPWFIIYFTFAIIITYLFPEFSKLYNNISWMGNKGIIIVLFLIGSSISIKKIKKNRN